MSVALRLHVTGAVYLGRCLVNVDELLPIRKIVVEEKRDVAEVFAQHADQQLLVALHGLILHSEQHAQQCKELWPPSMLHKDVKKESDRLWINVSNKFQIVPKHLYQHRRHLSQQNNRDNIKWQTRRGRAGVARKSWVAHAQAQNSFILKHEGEIGLDQQPSSHREAFDADMRHERVGRQDRSNEPMDCHLILNVPRAECAQEIVALRK